MMLSVNSPTKRTLEHDDTSAKRQKMAVPRFNINQYNYKQNPICIETYKDNDGHMVQFYNTRGNPYKVIAPPGICKFVRLGEGGNIGMHNWCMDEKSATLGFVYTNTKFQALANETPEAHKKRCDLFLKQQNDFLKFLKESQKDAITMLFQNCEQLRNTYMRKAKAVVSAKTSAKKVEETALKLMLGAAKSPIKENGSGQFEFQIKCGAFQNHQGEMHPRPVVVYDATKAKNERNRITIGQHETIDPSDIQHGAIIRPVFTMRLYATPGYKTFGTTYQLDSKFIILQKNGSGNVSGNTLSEEQLNVRAYEMKGVTNKSGNYNVYVNDTSGNKYLHRTPFMKTKYCDLENGNLGKFPNVTQETAKLTATLVEDEKSKAYFDHVEELVQEIATFLFNDPKLLKNEKKEYKKAAESVVKDTGGDVKSTTKNLFMDSIQSPIKRQGDKRELKISQRMFNTLGETLTRNTLKFADKDMKEIDCPNLERGCVIAPVLEPQVYILANGTAGVKMSIDLKYMVQMEEDEENNVEGESEVIYSADMF